MQTPQALDNLRAALANVPRGDPKVRVINGRKYIDHPHVEWLTTDAIEVCDLILSRIIVSDKARKKATEIRQGCINAGLAETVIHYSSCLYVLLDAANLICPPPAVVAVNPEPVVEMQAPVVVPPEPEPEPPAAPEAVTPASSEPETEPEEPLPRW